MPSNQPHIPVYSAGDLLRYATGRMTAQEMYALEKAAMEDPFLADAIEGYHSAAETYTQPVVQESMNRLAPAVVQKEERKMVPLWRRKIFQYAAAAAIVLGGGWFTYSLLNSKNSAKQQDIAMVPKTAEQEATKTDSSVATTVPPPSANETAANSKPVPVINPERQKTVQDKDPLLPDRDLAVTKNETANQAQAPTIFQDSIAKEKTDNTRMAATESGKNAVKQDAAPATTTNGNYVLEDASKSKSVAKRSAESFSKDARSAGNVLPRYVFHGRITDTKNNPLPYANVMINGENVGTYTDTKGSFNLIYDDSILPVKTRSLGYESQTVQLKQGSREQQIIMPEDEKLKESLALMKVQKSQAQQQIYKPLIVETDSLSAAQPVVSLFDYNTYLLNNNRLNELPQTNARAVELSFEIDKRGEVKNITVEQSSGKEQDEEAIRLLREGPKWKSNKSSRRARVKVKL